MVRTVSVALFCCLMTTFVAHADTVSGLTSRTGTDSVGWSQLGSCATVVPSGFTATSVDGVGVTGTFSGGGSGQVRTQTSCGWPGNFASGDVVLWTTANGPLTLTFNQGTAGGGVQIESNSIGGFTAQICDNLGDCFTELGNSHTSMGDNTAIFIGLQDASGADITSLTFSLTACSQTCNVNDFAINELSLIPGSAIPTPEPGTLMLVASGLLGLGCLQRRRRAQRV
jgi:hypothetical protein